MLALLALLAPSDPPSGVVALPHREKLDLVRAHDAQRRPPVFVQIAMLLSTATTLGGAPAASRRRTATPSSPPPAPDLPTSRAPPPAVGALL